jgi:AraC-like DNA-binding protein
MLHEPTSLAATARAIASAVEPFGYDPEFLFSQADIPVERIYRPGARLAFSEMQRLWKCARELSGDPCIGLIVGQELKPQAMHALGLSWLASPTLRDGFHRMLRYSQIASTILKPSLQEDDEIIRFVLHFGTGHSPPTEAVDATLTFIVRMCRLMSSEDFAPTRLTLMHSDRDAADRYRAYFQCPAEFSGSENTLCFDAGICTQPLPAGNELLAQETDRIAERYLATLQSKRIQDRVSEILLTLLPGGTVDQGSVAQRMHRSVSALQRQLKAEGTTYRQVLDETRKMLALKLIDEDFTLGQITYLLGFSDQANFSRAFKRWTGQAPTEFRD